MYQELKIIILETFSITEYEFLHSNRQDCVDARALCVHILSNRGFSERYISQSMGFSQQRVNSLKNGFKYRKNYELTINQQEVHKRFSELQGE